MKTAKDIVKENPKEIICVKPDDTIYTALLIMNEKNIGSVFIKEGGKIIGVWTERDLMRNTIIENFDPKTAKIKDYMTKEIVSVKHTQDLYKLLDIYLGRHLRQLLIEKEEEYIGLLSVGDVIKSCLIEKDRELKDLNEMVSWEYYENWKWKKK